MGQCFGKLAKNKLKISAGLSIEDMPIDIMNMVMSYLTQQERLNLRCVSKNFRDFIDLPEDCKLERIVQLAIAQNRRAFNIDVSCWDTHHGDTKYTSIPIEKFFHFPRMALRLKSFSTLGAIRIRDMLQDTKILEYCQIIVKDSSIKTRNIAEVFDWECDSYGGTAKFNTSTNAFWVTLFPSSITIERID